MRFKLAGAEENLAEENVTRDPMKAEARQLLWWWGRAEKADVEICYAGGKSWGARGGRAFLVGHEVMDR